MQKILAVVAALMLMGCGGGGSDLAQVTDTGIPEGNPGLDLLGSQQDGGWRIDLIVREASDLYQIAASVNYPPEKYKVVLVESGGGLGGPLDSFFASGETEPGNIDLAYTKRYAGHGADGDLRLASIKVIPVGEFNIRDFRIDSEEHKLLVRDSNRQPVKLPLSGGSQ